MLQFHVVHFSPDEVHFLSIGHHGSVVNPFAETQSDKNNVALLQGVEL